MIGAWILTGDVYIAGEQLNFQIQPSTVKQNNIFEVGNTYFVSFIVYFTDLGPVADQTMYIYNGSGKDELIGTVSSALGTEVFHEISFVGEATSGTSEGAIVIEFVPLGDIPFVTEKMD